MAIEIPMPKFGLSMEEGTIGAWLVKEGDAVKKGQPIAEVASEKLSNDAVAPQDGVIQKLLLEEGDTRPCGDAIALLAAEGEGAEPDAVTGASPIAKAGEEYSAAPVAAAVSAPAVAKAPAAKAGMPSSAPLVGGGKITPRAEKIAQEQGLAWDHIQGTGRHGLITIDDLKREGKPLAEGAAPVASAAPAASAPVVSAPAAAAPAEVFVPAKDGEVVTALNPMQKAIAGGMFQSLAGTAQTTIMTEANVHALVDVYKSLKPKYTAAGVKLSYTAMLIKAVAQALEEHPAVRMRLVDEAHCTTMENIDIGVAVDVPGGLIVPVIRAANLKDLRTICLELVDLSSRAQTGRLNEDEMGGAVITVTNLGMFGITYFTPVLNTPEPCILGCGAIVDKPTVRDGGIFMDASMNLSLTHDHRIVNGAPAARFLQQVVAGLADFRWA